MHVQSNYITLRKALEDSYLGERSDSKDLFSGPDFTHIYLLL